MIDVEKVSYSYRSHLSGEIYMALNDISLTIGSGEYVAVVGRNGSGKSTLVKLLNGLLLPDSGRVAIDGVETTDSERIWDVRTRVGIVFQNPDNQIVASVVEEDVAFAPENQGLPREEIVRRVEESLKQVELYDLRERLTHELSGGQKQRLAIAGILAMRPQVLVLDESTAMLDPVGRAEVIATVEELHRREGLTVIHVTHCMEEAIRAGRIIVMDAGSVVFDGPVGELFSDAALVKECYLDMPALAHLSVMLRDGGLIIPDGLFTVEAMAQCLTR